MFVAKTPGGSVVNNEDIRSFSPSNPVNSRDRGILRTLSSHRDYVRPPRSRDGGRGKDLVPEWDGLSHGGDDHVSAIINIIA